MPELLPSTSSHPSYSPCTLTNFPLKNLHIISLAYNPQEPTTHNESNLSLIGIMFIFLSQQKTSAPINATSRLLQPSREQVIVECAFAHYSFHPNAPPPSNSLT